MSISSVTAMADEWWARDFACSPADLRPSHTRVQEHTGTLAGSPGIWILVAGGSPLVSLPPDSMNVLTELANGWSSALVGDPSALLNQLRDRCPRQIEKVIGPAFIGYGHAEVLDLQAAALAQPLDSRQSVVASLKGSCSSEEWEHGGSDATVENTFGVFDAGNELLALGGYDIWNGTIAHISVVTHPRHRNRGLGRATVARAAEHALQAGLVPQYRTLRQNVASMNIARRLGFIEYGFSVYVRLSAG